MDDGLTKLVQVVECTGNSVQNLQLCVPVPQQVVLVG